MVVRYLLPHIVVCGAGVAVMIAFAVRRLMGIAYEPREGTNRYSFASVPPFLLDAAYWFHGLLVRAFVKLRLTPNQVTALAALVGFGAAAALALGHVALAGWLVVASGSFDAVDGTLARLTKRTSEVGAFIDACLDRYVDAALMLGLAVYHRDRWWMMAVCFAAAFSGQMVSYVRARGEAHGVVYKKGLMQRPERIFWLAAACTLAPLAAHLFEPGADHPFHYGVSGVAGLIAVLGLVGGAQRIVGVATRIARRESR